MTSIFVKLIVLHYIVKSGNMATVCNIYIYIELIRADPRKFKSLIFI